EIAIERLESAKFPVNFPVSREFWMWRPVRSGLHPPPSSAAGIQCHSIPISATIFSRDDAEAKSRVKALQQGLRDFGWLEGRNIRIDYRFGASDPNRIKEYVAELVRQGPDLIVASSSPVIS